MARPEEGDEQEKDEDDGPLEVRISAAEFLLADERDRGQSLNARGTATAAAGVALVALAKDPISAALKAEDRSCFVEGLLHVLACYVPVAVGIATLVVLLAVLRPQEFVLPADAELDSWLADPRMEDTADGARYSVLAGLVPAVHARRRLNESKADWLKVVYRLQASALVSALLMVGTLSV